MSPATYGDLFDWLPALYRAWEVGVLIGTGWVYRIEDGGTTDDGQALFTVLSQPTSPALDGERIS